ncbi:hypothetical protein DFS34DRAFT_333030 [Phlyctochytrium arcticum]|nr:hypothetical protein DFS34DRAFT_333030 [Phlyctochytrium arcticum]
MSCSDHAGTKNNCRFDRDYIDSRKKFGMTWYVFTQTNFCVYVIGSLQKIRDDFAAIKAKKEDGAFNEASMIKVWAIPTIEKDIGLFDFVVIQYRRQLDEERAAKLAARTKKPKKASKDKEKEKDGKKHKKRKKEKEKKRKRRKRDSSSSSGSDSDDSSSEGEGNDKEERARKARRRKRDTSTEIKAEEGERERSSSREKPSRRGDSRDRNPRGQSKSSREDDQKDERRDSFSGQKRGLDRYVPPPRNSRSQSPPRRRADRYRTSSRSRSRSRSPPRRGAIDRYGPSSRSHHNDRYAEEDRRTRIPRRSRSPSASNSKSPTSPPSKTRSQPRSSRKRSSSDLEEGEIVSQDEDNLSARSQSPSPQSPVLKPTESPTKVSGHHDISSSPPEPAKRSILERLGNRVRSSSPDPAIPQSQDAEKHEKNDDNETDLRRRLGKRARTSSVDPDEQAIPDLQSEETPTVSSPRRSPSPDS